MGKLNNKRVKMKVKLKVHSACVLGKCMQFIFKGGNKGGQIRTCKLHKLALFQGVFGLIPAMSQNYKP